MATFQTDFLMSSVRNISGKPMYFDMLPPHGKLLGVEAEYTCFGDIKSFVGFGLGGERNVWSLANMINEGLLEIKYTPAPIFWDPGRKRISTMRCFNDVLVVTQPCWISAGPALTPDGNAPFIANVVFAPPGQGSP